MDGLTPHITLYELLDILFLVERVDTGSWPLTIDFKEKDDGPGPRELS